MFKKFTTVAVAAILLPLAGVAQAEEVEIYLTDILDSTQIGYCLDIALGKGADAKPEDGLQGHTCYSNLGALSVDQAFDTEKFADGLLYMTQFDVCATAGSLEAGSALGLATCDGSEMQSFVFSGEGTITPANATDMCLTLGTDTRSGRSDTNQIKVLTLETCASDLSAYQEWAVRSVAN